MRFKVIERMSRLVRPLLTAGLVIATLACSRERDPVKALLGEIEEAAEARDAEAVLKRLATEFQGQGGLRRVDAGAELRRYFFAYEKIDVTLSDVVAEKEGENTRLRLRADFSGKPKNIGGLEGWLPALSAYRFELTLVGSGSRLLVARASWDRLDTPPGT